MSRLIFFSLALKDGLLPVVGAAPFPVLARQMPRLVVKRLNAGEDRGIRYFPFMGPVAGRRELLPLTEILPVRKLRRLAQKQTTVDHPDGPVLVHGRVGADHVWLTIHDAGDRSVFDERLELDPRQPQATMSRMLFELCGVLGWHGAPPSLPELQPPAIGHYLVALDDLLGLEAGTEREDGSSWLRAAYELAALVPDNTDARELIVELSARVVAKGGYGAEVAAVLLKAGEQVTDTSFVAQAATLLERAGQTEAATQLFHQIDERDGHREDILVRLVSQRVQEGDLASARSLLESAVARGVRSPRVLAQLSVVQQHVGDHDGYVATLNELAEQDDLPAKVARVVAAELTNEDRCQEALEVVERSLQKHPNEASLWLEKARALMRSGDGAAARPVLEAALGHEPSDLVRQEAHRLLRLAHAPETLAELRALDEALSDNNLQLALRRARTLLSHHREMGEAWLFMGIVRQRLGHRRRAIRALRNAIRCMPDLGEAHNRLGILLVEQGNHQQGFEYLQEAIRLLPWEAGPRVHLAQACYYLRRLDEGRAALEQAERLGANPQLLSSVRRTFFDS